MKTGHRFWNPVIGIMYPTLFKIGSFEIGTYGLMLAIGLYLALLLAGKRAPAYGMTGDHVASLSLWVVFGGILGAKLLFLILHWDDRSQWSLREGFVFYGSVFTGVPAAYFWARRNKIPFSDVLDMGTPSIPLAHGFGRIGCFLKGCCGGRPTTLPWPFSVESYDAVRVHPTQLYSAILNFALFGCLLWIGRKRGFKGRLFLIYALGYSTLRFLVEFLRDGITGHVGPLSSNQIICLVFIAVSLPIYMRLKQTKPLSQTKLPKKAA